MKKAYRDMFADESPLWRYFKEKEVRNKMAIDYGKEWEKFRGKHGLCRINVGGKQVHVRQIMDNQIQEIVNKREHSMKEFVLSMFTTEIVEGKKDGYLVELQFKGGPMYGKILITKKEFDTWLKRKEVK